MKYKSTRGKVSGLSFEDAILSGLADDGGLLIPDSIPKLTAQELDSWRGLKYADLSYAIIRKFVDPAEISDEELRSLVNASYVIGEDDWRNSEVVPLQKLKNGISVMELFHGPTFAFKDIALQFLGNLFSYVLQKRKQRMVILGATSGDTGGAAIYGVRGKPNIDCVILFPNGRTSKTQEMQMATVPDANIHTLALSGNFDDCQDIVKACFNSPLKKEFSLGAVNSINWARILAQIVYYAFIALKLVPKGSDTKVTFSVPTGNFGDILAGYYARLMGFPVDELIVASNKNDVLTRFFATGVYHNTGVVATMSPSMDIAISSNFERFLYDLMDQQAPLLADKMKQLKDTKKMDVTSDQLKRAKAVFSSYSVDEAECAKFIKEVYDKEGYMMCPHTAVGYGAMIKHMAQKNSKSPKVVLATAHYGKFIEEMAKHLTSETQLIEHAKENMPKKLKDLHSLKSRKIELPATEEAVAGFIKSKFSPRPKWLMPALVVLAAVSVGAAMRWRRSRS
mmetsp:Transcript_45043/g.107013  ORF Transcript_45043/g.107013 Transcript_45043/m.107013 type:complete len:509 (+) Transcript_45043:98-1624(+)